MFENIENLKLLSAVRKANRPVSVVENRKNHGFFFRFKGDVMLDFYDRKILAQEGEMSFIPKGASYTATALSEDSTYMCIHFEGDFAQTPQAGCYSLENFPEGEFMGACFAELWNLGTQADKYKCLSLFYSLLSFLSAGEEASYGEKSKYRILDPAIAYLKEHLYDSELRVGELHRLCGVSDTYFRKIFRSRFGASPHSYVLSRRIRHAEVIFNSGDFHTVEEVAVAAGFQDPLYFSKVFKKACGVSPSVYSRL